MLIKKEDLKKKKKERGQIKQMLMGLEQRF